MKKQLQINIFYELKKKKKKMNVTWMNNNFLDLLYI